MSTTPPRRPSKHSDTSHRLWLSAYTGMARQSVRFRVHELTE
uniref:Uncharacterized protein n=1 Tax=Arundo donax TaxID=35708 RepID=A0A0A9FC76_ARUDO